MSISLLNKTSFYSHTVIATSKNVPVQVGPTLNWLPCLHFVATANAELTLLSKQAIPS